MKTSTIFLIILSFLTKSYKTTLESDSEKPTKINHTKDDVKEFINTLKQDLCEVSYLTRNKDMIFSVLSDIDGYERYPLHWAIMHRSIKCINLITFLFGNEGGDTRILEHEDFLGLRAVDYAIEYYPEISIKFVTKQMIQSDNFKNFFENCIKSIFETNPLYHIKLCIKLTMPYSRIDEEFILFLKYFIEAPQRNSEVFVNFLQIYLKEIFQGPKIPYGTNQKQLIISLSQFEEIYFLAIDKSCYPILESKILLNNLKFSVNDMIEEISGNWIRKARYVRDPLVVKKVIETLDNDSRFKLHLDKCIKNNFQNLDKPLSQSLSIPEDDISTFEPIPIVSNISQDSASKSVGSSILYDSSYNTSFKHFSRKSKNNDNTKQETDSTVSLVSLSTLEQLINNSPKLKETNTGLYEKYFYSIHTLFLDSKYIHKNEPSSLEDSIVISDSESEEGKLKLDYETDNSIDFEDSRDVIDQSRNELKISHPYNAFIVQAEHIINIITKNDKFESLKEEERQKNILELNNLIFERLSVYFYIAIHNPKALEYLISSQREAFFNATPITVNDNGKIFEIHYFDLIACYAPESSLNSFFSNVKLSEKANINSNALKFVFSSYCPVAEVVKGMFLSHFKTEQLEKFVSPSCSFEKYRQALMKEPISSYEKLIFSALKVKNINLAYEIAMYRKIPLSLDSIETILSYESSISDNNYLAFKLNNLKMLIKFLKFGIKRSETANINFSIQLKLFNYFDINDNDINNHAIVVILKLWDLIPDFYISKAIGGFSIFKYLLINNNNNPSIIYLLRVLLNKENLDLTSEECELSEKILRH